MARLTMAVAAEPLHLAQPFRIAGYLFERFNAVVVTLRDGELQGRGEGDGVYYLKDDAANMLTELSRARDLIAEPRGTAHLDAARRGAQRRRRALWDLEAARTSMPVWRLAGMDAPRRCAPPSPSAPIRPRRPRARRYVQAKSIKIKLTGDLPLDQERVRAIRAARPDAWLGVDGNQGFVRAISIPWSRFGRANGSRCSNSRWRAAASTSWKASTAPSRSPPTRAACRWPTWRGGGPLPGHQHQARQVRRPDRGPADGRRSAATGPGRHGRHHGRHQPGHGAGFVLGQVCDIVDLDGATFLAKDRQPGVVYATARLGRRSMGRPAQGGCRMRQPAEAMRSTRRPPGLVSRAA
jgi:hypothetical protein